MKKHQIMIASCTLALGLVLGNPVFAQAPPPVDPAPGAELIVLATHPASAELSVSTPGWEDGADIPFEFTQYENNTFPGLEWSAGPEGTKSYAIIMQDSAFVVRGSPILHWSVVNIPTSTTSLPAGMKAEEKPSGAIYGPNYRGAAQPYLGPRTPPGAKHIYHMQVLALDIMLPTDFAPKSYAELVEPLTGHVLASGTVNGLGQAKPK